MIRLFFCPCLCLSFFLVASCRANHDHDIASTYNTPAPPPGFNHNKASFKPGIAIIVGVLTTIFSITFLILLYVKHCKREDYDYHNNPRDAIAANSARKNSGIDRNVIYMLPVFRFGSLRGQKDGLECAVCLNKFEPTEVLRLLPKCKHAFHVECVDTWLDAHSTCPLCRYRVDPEDILLIEDKNPHQEDNSQQRVQGEEEMMEIRRVSGRHSSAGERGSSGSGYLQVIVENPPNRSKSSMEFRRSLDSSMRLKRDGGSVSMGCFERSRRDGLLLAGKEDSKKSFERRFEHRIVVSSGGSDSLGGSETQQRWSNVHPSDLLYLRSEMIISDSRRMSGSSSRPSVASPSGQRHQQNQKVGEGGGINEDGGQGKGKGNGKKKRENGRSVINERSVSEITGVSRVRSNEEQERRKERRKRQEEGFVNRWLAWISDTTTNKSSPPPPPPPPPPAVSHAGGQPSNSSP